MVTIAFMLALVAAPGLGPRAKIDSFSSLSPGSTVEIDFHSDGCRKAGHYQFLYHAGVQPTTDVKNITFLSNKVFALPTLELTPDDVRGLDKALIRYRSLKSERCTSLDRVTYKEVTDGKVVAWEKAVDDNCSNYVAVEAKGVLDFQRIVWRAKAAKANLRAK